MHLTFSEKISTALNFEFLSIEWPVIGLINEQWRVTPSPCLFFSRCTPWSMCGSMCCVSDAETKWKGRWSKFERFPDRYIVRAYRAWNYVNWTLSIAARDSFLYWLEYMYVYTYKWMGYIEYDKCRVYSTPPTLDCIGFKWCLLDELPFFHSTGVRTNGNGG